MYKTKNHIFSLSWKETFVETADSCKLSLDKILPFVISAVNGTILGVNTNMVHSRTSNCQTVLLIATYFGTYEMERVKN